jgi:Tfp pilus assembly protein PilW
MNTRGVSLIEILLGLLIVTIASIAALQHFALGKASMARQGNRRAALERGRERLEQLMAVSVAGLPPAAAGVRWCSAGNPCATWIASGAPVAQTDAATGRRIETTAQWVDDPSAGTGAALDAVALEVKVWYMPGSTDNDFHRIVLRTLRAP